MTRKASRREQIGEFLIEMAEHHPGRLFSYAEIDRLLMGYSPRMGEEDIQEDDGPAAVVVERKRRHLRKQVLGFGSESIDPAATATFLAKPQQLFKPKRLYVTGGSDVDVVEIKIGNKSQLVGSQGNVPGASFGEEAFDTEVDFLTANNGNDVIVEVTNVSAATVTIACAMVGLTAE